MLLITLQKNIKWVYTSCFCAKGKNILQSFRPPSHEIKLPFYLLSWSRGDWKTQHVNYPSCVYMPKCMCICGSLKHQGYATNVTCKSLLWVPWCLTQGHMLFRLPLHTSGLQMLLSEFPRLPAMTLLGPCFMSQTLSLLHMKTVLDSSAASASQWKRLIAANKYY